MIVGDLESGRRLLTAEQAAAAAGMTTKSWREGVSRGRLPAADGRVGRTPVWYEDTVTEGQ